MMRCRQRASRCGVPPVGNNGHDIINGKVVESLRKEKERLRTVYCQPQAYSAGLGASWQLSRFILLQTPGRPSEIRSTLISGLQRRPKS